MTIMALTFVSCSDDSNPTFSSSDGKNDKVNQSKINIAELSAQERANIANKNENDSSRWNLSWWDLSHSEMADTLRPINGEVLIGFKEPDMLQGTDGKGQWLVSRESIQEGIEFLENSGVEIVTVYEIIPTVFARVPIDVNLISTIRDHPLIDNFEPNISLPYTWELDYSESQDLNQNETKSKSSYEEAWNIKHVKAPEAWNHTDGSGVKIVVIDSGIWPVHDSILTNSIHSCDGTSGLDVDDHGTPVAGIAVALDNSQDITGVAHSSDLYSAKIGEFSDGWPSPSNVICAIQYAINISADVVNMSIGTTGNSNLEAAIKDAYNNHDIVLVAAAGNHTVSKPAGYPEVIAVAAVNDNNERLWSSPVSTEIEISAPGVFVKTTCINNGTGGTCTKTGTSYAAPHVAGAAALIRSYYPNLSNAQIRNKINNNAQYLGAANEYGHGLLDVEAALGAGGANPPDTPVVFHSVSSYEPFLTWNNVVSATGYEIQREYCCGSNANFTVNNGPFNDGEMIHQNLQAVSNAPPNDWLRYRVRSQNQAGSSNWTSWMYYYRPDDGDPMSSSDN